MSNNNPRFALPTAEDERRAYTDEPERCPLCGGEIIFEDHGICHCCETKAIDKLSAFLKGLAPEELAYIDYMFEGTSLAEFVEKGG